MRNEDNYSLSAYGLLVVLVSMLGFMIENVWIVITEGFIDNRNMNAPFLLGYGVMILSIYTFMGTPWRLKGILRFAKGWTKEGRFSLYFLASFLTVCSVEIITGYVVEMLCHLHYWSYETLPLHITRYTSLPTSVSFALLIVFFMGVIYTPFMRCITEADNGYLRIVSVLMVGLLVFDFLSCFFYMWEHREFYYLWKVQLLPSS